MSSARPKAKTARRHTTRTAPRRTTKRKWPNLMKVVAGIGAIAAAILSVAGVVRLLTPDEKPSPRGSFGSVTADPGQGLTEFSARLQTASLGPGTPGASGTARAAVDRPALEAVAEAQTTDGSPEPTEPQTTPPTQPPPQTTAPETTPETVPGEPTPPSRGGDALGLREQLDQALPTERRPESWEVQTVRGKTTLAVPRRDRMEAMSWAEGAGSAQGKALVAATGLLKVFRASRTQPVPGAERSEPVGVAVNYNLTLDNLKGHTVVVRWTMYRTRSGSPLPHDWLVNRRVYRRHVKRSHMTVSREFWVPLPRRRGPYFVRLSAWDGNDRLDYADSRPPVP